MTEAKTLKLYVVGETSPNRNDWNMWSEYSLVLAESPEAAIELDGRRQTRVAEVAMDRPAVLVMMPEPDWVEDL